MRVEEEYIDVLQNIESAITGVYHEHNDTSDYDVMRALEALVDTYSGEKIGRPARDFRLSDRERLLMERVREICEWRLGHTKLREAQIEPLTIDEVIICLKRIRKSAEFWNKKAGRQGYLQYISEFVL